MDKEIFRLNAEIEERHWWFRGRRTIVRRVVEALATPGADHLVVDVGCGTGGTLSELDASYRCVGIDPTREAILLARARFPEIQFVHGIAPDDLPEEARRADVFLLMDVLEHVEDDRGLLERLIRSSSPGGHFVITVPADPTLWSPHDESHGHYRRYREDSLSALWRELPVSVRLLSYFNARLFPAVKGIRTLSRLLRVSAGKAGTDLSMPPSPLNRFLYRTFAGEAGRLERLLEQGSREGYPFGVSLMAVLRREQGD